MQLFLTRLCRIYYN